MKFTYKLSWYRIAGNTNSFRITPGKRIKNEPVVKKNRSKEIKIRFLKILSPIKYFILLAILPLLLQCSQSESFRLYNLNKPEVLEINLPKGLKIQDRIDSVSFNNENFSGEYLFHLYKNRVFYSRGYQTDIDTSTILLPEYKFFSDSLIKIYGYSEKSSVSPVGFLVLSGDKGTVIDVIFYMFYYERGIATGIGRDNKGNVFRAFLGEK